MLGIKKASRTHQPAASAGASAVEQSKRRGRRMAGLQRGLALWCVLGVMMACAGTAHAAQLFWDADGDASTAIGGSGTWDATALTWRSGSDTGALQAWADGSEAVFGGTSGTVTCNTNFNPAGLTFATTAYTLSGTGTLTVASPGITAATITNINLNVSNGGSLLNIGGVEAVFGSSAVISGAGGLSIGANTKVTTNISQTYAGTTTIAAGTGFLQIKGAAQGAGDIVIGSGAALYLANSSLNLPNNITGTGGKVALFGNATLRGTNTYTGATTVSTYVLTISGASALAPASAVTVASGGRLAIPLGGTFGGTGTLTLSGSGGGNGALDSNVNSVTTTITSPIVLSSGATIREYGVSHTLNLQGGISGTGDLNLIGGAAATTHFGTIGLSGAASYSGNTTITNGSQQLTVNLTGGNNRLSTGSLTFATLGAGYTNTLDLNANTQSIATITGTGSTGAGSLNIIKSTGAVGTLNVTSSAQPAITVNNFTQTNTNISTPGYVQINNGTYTLNSGTLGIGAELLNSFTGSGTFTQNGGTVDAFQSRVATAGTGTYNLNGGTFLTDKLGGTGGTSIVNFNGGTLGISTRNTSFAPSDFFNSVTHAYILNNGAKIDTTNASVGMSQVLEQGASSTGGLTKLGANTLTLTGASTYTGSTTISSGVLSVAADNNLGGTTANVILSGGTLQATANFTSSRSLAVSTNSGVSVSSNATLTLTGLLSGTGTLTKSTSGTLTLQGTTANTFSGGLTIIGGRINTNAAGALGSGPITLTPSSNVSLGINSSATASSVTLPNSIAVNAGTSGTREILATVGKTLTLSGAISGTAALTFNANGAGTVVLAGSSPTFTGSATVSGGVVRLDASNRLADTLGLTLDGGTFSTGGFFEKLGAFTATSAANSKIDFGASDSSTLRFASFGSASADVQVLAYDGADRLFIGAAGTSVAAGLGGTKSDGVSNGGELRIKFASPDGLANGPYNADQSSTSEVVPIVPSVATSGALISEFRFRGANGSDDEFVEIANTTGSPLNVGGWKIVYQYDPGTGTGLASGNATLAVGTLIAARGHLLFTGTGYSLSSYAAPEAIAVGAAMTGDATDNSGVALVNAAGTTVDRAGFATSDASLRSGTGLPAAPTANGEYAFVRDNGTLRLKNTGSNALDFLFVSTTGGAFANTGSGTLTSMLGAPGPENTASPLQPLSGLVVRALDTGVSIDAMPNRVRDDTTGSSPRDFGTIELRRSITNNTGHDITRLRFRAVRLTTLNSPGYVSGTQADLRLLSSPGTSNISISSAGGGGTKTTLATTLEAPSSPTIGGGANSSVVEGTVTLSSPLKDGDTLSYAFLLGVVAKGNFSVALSVEAVPAP